MLLSSSFVCVCIKVGIIIYNFVGGSAGDGTYLSFILEMFGDCRRRLITGFSVRSYGARSAYVLSVV